MVWQSGAKVRTPIITRVLAIAVSAAAGGCANMANYLPRQLQPSPPPSAYQSHSEERREHSRSKTETAAPSVKTSARRAVSSGTAAAPTEAKTTVTLVDDEAKKSLAEKLLDDSNARLAKIDRSRLSAEDASTYQQAEGLAYAARNALEQRDYVAASGLAEKASVLTNSISSRTPAATPTAP